MSWCIYVYLFSGIFRRNSCPTTCCVGYRLGNVSRHFPIPFSKILKLFSFCFDLKRKITKRIVNRLFGGDKTTWNACASNRLKRKTFKKPLIFCCVLHLPIYLYKTVVVPFFGCNDYMIIFCCSPGQVRWLCSSLWTGGPLLGCGIFFYPPTDLNLLGRRRRRRTDGVCMCRVPSGVSSCICVIVCCVCECPSDWLSVTPEEKNRIFPLHRTFFFDIFFFPPLFLVWDFLERTEFFETWKTRSLWLCVVKFWGTSG